MIITDSTEKPSNRFIETVKPYFESQGYSYHKPKKLFSKEFTHGTKSIGFWFRISVLTSASLNWRIQFENLEKLCASLRGTPRQYKSAFTVATDMANYTRWEPNPKHTFYLYDEASLHYDDFSINNAAQKIIAGYEKYTVPFFDKYQDYQDLYSTFSNNDGFSGMKEVLLAKYFSIPDFDKLVSKFEFEVLRRNDKIEIATFQRLVQFLHKEDIKKWLD
jgi:hypothetical protein